MRHWPRPQPTTCGQVRQLLKELACLREPRNDRHDVFHEPRTDMIYIFTRGADDAPAPESSVCELRAQLYWRGLMEVADFDAYFAGATAVKSS